MDLKRLNWTCDPMDVIAAWPDDRQLMVLHSARPDPRWGRWSILAAPRAIVRDLAKLQEPTGRWIGYLGYDLGRQFEPTAGSSRRDTLDRGWPTAELGWCPDAFLFDHASGAWFEAGSPRISFDSSQVPGSFSAGALTSSVTPDDYLWAVARTIEYIAAGDIFQANLTHRLTAPFEGSTRRLALEALAASGAWYGAYLELPDGRCLLSMSPELFLDVDARRVVTRPIKGTRPATVAPQELLASAKDAAELNMIVDLMRNDLGRVCEFGSVRVPRPRTIETYPTVHHGVGEVTGLLRPDVTLHDLLAATFPAGSITGAPKIRAMQIIDELEPVGRGPYCGAIGLISHQRTVFNVAIRTIVLTGQRPAGSWGRMQGLLDYGVGGGIVADSLPVAEYRETMDKAEILRRVLQVRQPDRAAVTR